MFRLYGLKGDGGFMFYSVAVDGPAGSGKSTISKIVAKELNIVYIDTGAMYRAVAFYCIKNGIDTKEQKAVIAVLDDIKIDIKLENNTQKTYVSGENVTDKIRSQEIGAGASDVGVIAEVRKKLVDIQRDMAKGMSVIMDGRDIGTNVLKNADVKIYISASADERAKRRCEELKNIGVEHDFELVKNKIIQRDKNDMTRENNPLKKAEDAIYIDTTFMGIDEVKNTVIKIIKEKVGL